MAKDSHNIVDQIREMLNEGKASEALAVLTHNRDTSGPTQNTRAACLLRLGQAESALRVLTQLVFPRSGVTIAIDAPLNIKTNYATALLMMGNIEGCLAAIGQFSNKSDPSVQRLILAITRWRKTQSIGRRIAMKLGIFPHNISVPLDYPPGDI